MWSPALHKVLETPLEQASLPLSRKGRIWQLPLVNVTCLPEQAPCFVGSVPPPPLLISRFFWTLLERVILIQGLSRSWTLVDF